MPIPVLPKLCHLSVEAGCGGTSFGLQCARQLLVNEQRVVWVAPKSPDPTRFQQLMNSVPIHLMAKFHLLPSGDEVATGVKSALILIEKLNVSLLVIDDWTPPIGQTSAENIEMIQQVVDSLGEEQQALIISSSFEDATGGQKSLARSKKKIESLGFTTWFLTPSNKGVSQRELIINDSHHQLTITNSGFE